MKSVNLEHGGDPLKIIVTKDGVPISQYTVQGVGPFGALAIHGGGHGVPDEKPVTGSEVGLQPS